MIAAGEMFVNIYVSTHLSLLVSRDAVAIAPDCVAVARFAGFDKIDYAIQGRRGCRRLPLATLFRAFGAVITSLHQLIADRSSGTQTSKPNQQSASTSRRFRRHH